MAEQKEFIGLSNVQTVVQKLVPNIVMGPAFYMRKELDRLGIVVETDVQNLLTYTVFAGKGGETRRKIVGDVKESKLGYFFERTIKTEICVHRVRVNKDAFKERPANFRPIDGSAAPSFPETEKFVNKQAQLFSKDVLNCVANGERTEAGEKLGMFNGLNAIISADINDGIVNKAAGNLVETGVFDAPQSEGDSAAYDEYVKWEQGWSEELLDEEMVNVYLPVDIALAIRDAYEQKHRSHQAAVILDNGNFTLPAHPKRTFIPWNRLKGTRIFASIPDNIVLAVGNTSEDAVVDIEKDPSHDTTEMVFQIQSPFGVGVKDPSARALVTNGGTAEQVFISGDYQKDGIFATPSNAELGSVTIKNGSEIIENGTEVAKGTTLTLTATAKENKTFKKWSTGQTTATINIVTTGDPMYFTAIFE